MGKIVIVLAVNQSASRNSVVKMKTFLQIFCVVTFVYAIPFPQEDYEDCNNLPEIFLNLTTSDWFKVLKSASDGNNPCGRSK